MPTVLIASPSALRIFKQRNEFRDALTFADNEGLRAFEAIVRQRADAVVVDSAFAATSRGTAFINRIKADPGMRNCDVRVMTPEDERGTEEPENAPPDASPVVAAAGDVAVAEQPNATVTLDFDRIRGVELMVDGNPATLVDLSSGGAQIMSPTSLKPHQRVRMTLPGAPLVRLHGEISWAIFEMPGGVPRYRAGVSFIDPDLAGIMRFIEANK